METKKIQVLSSATLFGSFWISFVLITKKIEDIKIAGWISASIVFLCISFCLFFLSFFQETKNNPKFWIAQSIVVFFLAIIGLSYSLSKKIDINYVTSVYFVYFLYSLVVFFKGKNKGVKNYG